MKRIAFVRMTALLLVVVFTPGWTQAGEKPDALAAEAANVLQEFCVRCHKGKGSEGGDHDFADRTSLVKEVIKPGDVAGSKVIQKILAGEMPPEGETPRPGLREVHTLFEWIKAKAPDFPKDVTKRPHLRLVRVLQAIRDHLRDADAETRPYLRYFTVHNIANNPAVSDAQLRLTRAALSKALNSLSRGPRIVVPTALKNTNATVFAIDVRLLGWSKSAWADLERAYPYGVRATNEEELTKLDDELREHTGCDIPVLRGDWFVATATRPPLYHALLQLPENAKTLEHELGVDIAETFLHPANQNIARAGFPKSGVSGQNRMVQRNETKFRDVVYWKSYDFKPTNGRANLTRFPLGPLNLVQGQKHPFAAQAFVHDGGEIIFSLQNGLHAYLLVNGKDERIDVGPIDVVSDPLKTSGTPEIVTGVSCMTCHKHGMIGLQDAIRENNTVVLEPKKQVERLYLPKDEMDGLLERDSKVFLDALEKAIGPFLREGADKAKPIPEFPEPVGPLARAYRSGYLDLAAVARELDVDDSATIEKQVGRATLKRLGLAGLLDGGVVSRLEWESRLEGVSIRLNGLSLMQQLALELHRSPVVPQ